MLEPHGVESFVKRHADGIVLLNEVVELALHETVRAQRVLDMTSHAELGVELNRLEVLDILGVEEHVAENGLLLVDSQWVTSENDTLKEDGKGVWWKSVSCSQELQVIATFAVSCEDENLAWREDNRHVNRSLCRHIGTQETHVLELIT